MREIDQSDVLRVGIADQTYPVKAFRNHRVRASLALSHLFGARPNAAPNHYILCFRPDNSPIIARFPLSA